MQIQVLLIRIQNPLLLVGVLAFSPQLLLQLPPPVLPDVNRIAAMTPAVLAPMHWQCRPPLQSGHLAQTTLLTYLVNNAYLPVLRESFHAVSATPVLHSEVIIVLLVPFALVSGP